MEIEDWNGDTVAIRRSRGGVLTLERWQDNVVGGPPWPEALLTQVRGYVARPSHFESEAAAALAADLGRISKFQSINSEDAVTYSFFGTLAHAPDAARRETVQWLCDRIGLAAVVQKPVIDQWARVFHPNAPGSPRGPELDARIDDPAVLIYVEAKWSAGIGTGKGKNDVPDDQIVLRRDSLRDDPALVQDQRAHVVLGVSEFKPDLGKWHEVEAGARPVTVAWLTWDELAECPHHPYAAEFTRYLAWKRKHASS